MRTTDHARSTGEEGRANGTTALALAALAVAHGACVLGDGSGDGGGGSGGSSDIGTIDACELSNVEDADDCDASCDAAVEGEEGVYKCTVACDEDADCGDGFACVGVDGDTSVCLEDCSEDACSSDDDACDDVLLACVAAIVSSASGSSETCDVELVSDASACDADCDAVYAEDGARPMCTTSCDVIEQDCGDDAFRCVTIDDDGVCVLSCSAGKTCPDDYACEQTQKLCVPAE